MKIAAGVLLIIAAIMNVIAGSGYALAGAVGDAASGIVSAAADQANANGAAMDENSKKEMDKAMGNLSNATSGLKYFGFFLLAMFVMQLVGGIMCFVKKGAMFILIVALLSIAAEIGGVVLTSFGLANIIGLVAGILAFFAAMAIKKEAGGAAPAPAAPAA